MMTDKIVLLEREFETRRLMLVLLHVTQPALIVTALNLFKASYQSPQNNYLPCLLFFFSIFIGFVISVLVSAVMVRTHSGIALTAHAINKPLYNEDSIGPFNRRGVTCCFYMLSVISAIFFFLITIPFMTIAYDGWVYNLISMVAMLPLFVGAVYHLRNEHGRAENIVKKRSLKFCGSSVYIRRHRLMSLQATHSDMTVLVVMSVTLFSALFFLYSEISLFRNVLLEHHKESASALQSLIVMYLLAVMFLSQVMFVRLRIALAEHSSELAYCNGSPATAWQVTYTERTFMLYTILTLLGMAGVGVAASSMGAKGIVISSVVYVFLSFKLYFKSIRDEMANYCRRYNRNARDLLHGQYVDIGNQ